MGFAPGGPFKQYTTSPGRSPGAQSATSKSTARVASQTATAGTDGHICRAARLMCSPLASFHTGAARGQYMPVGHWRRHSSASMSRSLAK